MKNPDIHTSWMQHIGAEFSKDYMKQISAFLKSEVESGQVIYPHPKNIFQALNITHFDDVRVVILGQDPYHGAGQAHGLSFSVQEGVKHPPSLRNIFKELDDDIATPLNSSSGKEETGRSGNLTAWAEQGVLMLNAILTVRAGEPASHSKIGWGQFTDMIIQKISEQKQGVVFVLWGGFARGKKVLIDTSKHHIIESPHPSPFSAHSGFFGSKPFSKTNMILQEQGGEVIDWR